MVAILAFDREDIPLQPAGWQPEEEDARLDELRLNVVEVRNNPHASQAAI